MHQKSPPLVVFINIPGSYFICLNRGSDFMDSVYIRILYWLSMWQGKRCSRQLCPWPISVFRYLLKAYWGIRFSYDSRLYKSIFCIETVLKSAAITFILIHVFFQVYQKEKFQNGTSDSFIHFSSWARVWLSWLNCTTKEYLRQNNYENFNYISIWWNTDIELLKWWMERRTVWA